MQQNNLNVKSRLAEADRCLVFWARESRRGYVDIGYPHRSAEQVFEPSTGVFVPDPTEWENKVLLAVNALKCNHQELFIVVKLEYTKLNEWFWRCREKGGWRNHLTNELIKVEQPKKSDFLRWAQANYRVKSTDYYDLLKSAKTRVANDVLGNPIKPPSFNHDFFK